METTENDYSAIASAICKKGMGAPLMFLLEAHRPLVNLSKTLIVAFLPFIKFFVKKDMLDSFLSIFDSYENYNKFLKCLSNMIKEGN